MTEIVETWLNLKCACLCLKGDRRGVTVLEYGLIASLIAVAVITAVTTLGTKIGGTFTNIAGKMT